MRALLLTLTTCLFILPAQAQYSGGTGEADDPYQIATAADLIALGETPDDYNKHFILTADIDLDPNLPGRKVFDGAVIAPDTNDVASGFQNIAFTGVFDGTGHTIANLTITGGSYLGLFGRADSGAEVKNLGVIEVTIAGSGRCIGALAGCTGRADIITSYSTGAVGGSSSVGGLVGESSNAMTGPRNPGGVRGMSRVRGLAGAGAIGSQTQWSYSAQISESYSTARVNGEGSVGGLVGWNAGAVTDCFSMSSVTGNTFVGGLVGESYGAVSGSYSRGSVCGTDDVGGLVGYSVYGPVSHCHSTSSVTGENAVGGLVGWNKDIVTNSFSLGSVAGNRFVGGVVGENGGTISDSYSRGAVHGTEAVGGLVGYSHGYGSVSHCYSASVVTGEDVVGGLVGYNAATVAGSLWDVTTSGEPNMCGNIDGVGCDDSFGRPTEGMQSADSFLDVGWDFVGETANGSAEIWKISEAMDYPRLSWEKYSGGTGRADYPYEIATAADLIALGETPDDYNKHFILTADIDLDPNLPGRKVFDKAVIAPEMDDAESDFQGTAFTGVFDGNDHTIYGLMIDSPGDCLGLFGEIRYDGWVCRVRLAGGVIRSTTSLPFWALIGLGGLAGRNDGVIMGCCCDMSVEGAAYVGGLVGANFGIISTSYSGGSVAAADNRAGGLVGENGGTILNCYSTGAAQRGDLVGGLVGNNLGSISDCYSTGFVTGEGGCRGGLVGDNKGFVFGSFWDADTSGTCSTSSGTALRTAKMQDATTYLDAGWDLLGERQNGVCEVWTMPAEGGYPQLSIFSGYVPPVLQGGGTTTDPYVVKTAEHLGTLWYRPLSCYGLVADVNLAGISWTTAPVPAFAGTLDGRNHVIRKMSVSGGSMLGLFGELTADALVTHLGLEDVNVAGAGDDIGGLAGGNSGTISDCYGTGSVSGLMWVHSAPYGYLTDSTTDRVGGLLGSNSGTVLRSCSTCDVSGEDQVGGLLGWNGGPVLYCYSEGSVNGQSNVGGLAGSNVSGSITDSYSTSQIDGGSPTGGLVGEMMLRGHLTRCYYAGRIDGYGAGLVGDNDGSSIIASYWDIETSQQDYMCGNSAGGCDSSFGRSKAEMQRAATFVATVILRDPVSPGGRGGGGTGGSEPVTVAGWDFEGETANGVEDIWWIDEGRDYPRLWWQPRPLQAYAPNPQNGETELIQPVMLSWHAGSGAARHDVYLGQDANIVALATIETAEVYRDRLPAETAAYEAGILEFATTYYWRIDEVNETDPGNSCKGDIWQFTTAPAIRYSSPVDGGASNTQSTALQWIPGRPDLHYDVYFGADANAVTDATPESVGIYQGRQAPEETNFEPGALEIDMTYYWRVDAAYASGPAIWRGPVWRFVTASSRPGGRR